MREDLRVKDKNIEKCEAELRELGAALRLYEEENSRLAEERDHWSRLAKEWEGHCASLPEQEDRMPDIRYYQSRLRDAQTELNLARGGTSPKDVDSMKLEEQLKAANKRYQATLRRSEIAEREKADLELKMHQLLLEKKKYAEKWQRYPSLSLSNRVKSEEKLKIRLKDLEEAGNLLSIRLETALQQSKELETKLHQSEQSRSQDYAAVRKASEESRKLQLQLKLAYEENDMLAMLNKELSMKACRHEGGRLGGVSARLETAYAEEKERNQILEEDINRLRGELAALRTQMSRSTAASPDPTPRTGRKKEESLSSLVRSLKEMAQSPLRTIKDSDAESDPNSSRRSDQPSESLSSRVHVIHSARSSHQRNAASVQSLLHKSSETKASLGVVRIQPGYWTPTRPPKESQCGQNSHDRSWG